MHLLFANTGIQIIHIPLPVSRRFTTAQIGYGWQYCRAINHVEGSGGGRQGELPFLQWQIIQGRSNRLFLAIDTSLGDPHLGHICSACSLVGDHLVMIEGLLDLTGEPLAGIPRIELRLRASTVTSGDARAVHLVVDFGNSRSGALIIEASGENGPNVKMTPFELLDRVRLDTWDEQSPDEHAQQWFQSKTRWCDAPYLSPRELTRTEYQRQTVRRFWGKKTTSLERERQIRPPLFQDLSLARMGREADDVSQFIQPQGQALLGVSSPKRYLWAGDERWLDGGIWHMADPHNRSGEGVFLTKLRGALLPMLADESARDEAERSAAPSKPRHAPRVLMTAALYELLCQAYCFVNSQRYRTRTSDAHRAREIRSLSLTYPSGMCQEERDQFRTQAQLAIRIFADTLGRHQAEPPELSLSIDEAGAVQLTFIWSELQSLAQDPQLWFSLMSSAESVPGPSDMEAREVRIASIDIGGGTSNLMIASYHCEPGIDDRIIGRVLHRDGLGVAGDHLIKRLLQQIIVPAFATSVGFEPNDALLLFGPEVPLNRGFRAERVEWMNRLFLPLAEAYLQRAVDEVPQRVLSHTDPALIDPSALESLARVCHQLRGPGYYNLRQPLLLPHDAPRLAQLVEEVFGSLLNEFCRRIMEERADVVLLAGRPTKLPCLESLIRRRLPLSDSRVIPMYQYYAGTWYPYQDPSGCAPGRVVDPKSAVVVGAAIKWLEAGGLLPQFRFSVEDFQRKATWYWGVMTEATLAIRPDRLLFRPASTEPGQDFVQFTTSSQRVLLGRVGRADSQVQASLIYVLRLEPQARFGPTEVTVRLRRVRATTDREEHLELESVSGTVAGEPAALNHNVFFQWRTLPDERFFLDTGGLDQIELTAISGVESRAS